MKLIPGSCLSIGGCTVDAVGDRQGVWRKQLCGGNSLFAAVGANYWLTPYTVKVISLVGADYPQDWLGEIEQAGIDISGIERAPYVFKYGFAASYDSTGRRTMHDEVETRITGQEAISETASSDLLEFSRDPILGDKSLDSLALASFIHCAPVLPANLFHNLKLLQRRGLWLQMDPGEESASWSDLERISALEAVDAYLPSEDEVDTNVQGMMNTLSENPGFGRPDTIVVKHGMAGSVIYQRSTRRILAIPRIPVDASDPTGAGDAYCGGFLAGMAITGNPFVAGLTGTVSASYVVETSGVMAALRPADAMLWDRLAWLVKQIKYDLNKEDENALKSAKIH
jgi:sugar/nucleoside kinase (ribokinase family)